MGMETVGFMKIERHKFAKLVWYMPNCILFFFPFFFFPLSSPSLPLFPLCFSPSLSFALSLSLSLSLVCPKDCVRGYIWLQGQNPWASSSFSEEGFAICSTPWKLEVDRARHGARAGWLSWSHGLAFVLAQLPLQGQSLRLWSTLKEGRRASAYLRRTEVFPEMPRESGRLALSCPHLSLQRREGDTGESGTTQPIDSTGLKYELLCVHYFSLPPTTGSSVTSFHRNSYYSSRWVPTAKTWVALLPVALGISLQFLVIHAGIFTFTMKFQQYITDNLI